MCTNAVVAPSGKLVAAVWSPVSAAWRRSDPAKPIPALVGRVGPLVLPWISSWCPWSVEPAIARSAALSRDALPNPFQFLSSLIGNHSSLSYEGFGQNDLLGRSLRAECPAVDRTNITSGQPLLVGSRSLQFVECAVVDCRPLSGTGGAGSDCTRPSARRTAVVHDQQQLVGFLGLDASSGLPMTARGRQGPH